jgi:hypothetical protein
MMIGLLKIIVMFSKFINSESEVLHNAIKSKVHEEDGEFCAPYFLHSMLGTVLSIDEKDPMTETWIMPVTTKAYSCMPCEPDP